MPDKSPSLAGRAALALLLMIGFYLLALALVCGLLAIPILEYQSLHRVHPRLAIACAIGAAVIVWSVLPRWDKFPPPGIALTKQTQPQLFALIEPIARATGQAMPAEVYLVPDVNAFVAQRGGMMGFLSRRVLGLGLPLLRVLSVDQIRAVLAHEFGHFHGGDTRLGPWVYKTRSAIARTVSGLAKAQSLLSLPFHWYGNMFLRITHGISRAQEYAADRLAARVVGAEPLGSGLQLLPAAATLFGVYLDREVGPVLNAGRRPPLGAGFQLFLGSNDMGKAARAIAAQAMQQSAENAYDTHPPTPLRIAALAHLPARISPARDDRLAIELLADGERLEAQLLAFMTGQSKVTTLPTIEWRDVGEQVVMPQWRALVAQWSLAPGRPLEGVTLGTLPDRVQRAAELGKSLAPAQTPAELHASYGAFVLAAAAGVALRDAGFAVDAQPGCAVTLERDGHRFTIIDDLAHLADGSLTAATWQARCAGAGVAALQLVPAPA